MKLNVIKTILLFIIIIAFVLFSSKSIKVMEGLSYKSINESIIQQDMESNMLRNSNNRSIVCCDNYTSAPNVKCVKQLDQNTCALPNSDGTCSGDNYTTDELAALETGNESSFSVDDGSVYENFENVGNGPGWSREGRGVVFACF